MDLAEQTGGAKVSGYDIIHGETPDGLRSWVCMIGMDKGATGRAVWASVEDALAIPGINRVKITGTNERGDRFVCFINRRGAWVLHGRVPTAAVRTWNLIAYPDKFQGVTEREGDEAGD